MPSLSNSRLCATVRLPLALVALLVEERDPNVEDRRRAGRIDHRRRQRAHVHPRRTPAPGRARARCVHAATGTLAVAGDEQRGGERCAEEREVSAGSIHGLRTIASV